MRKLLIKNSISGVIQFVLSAILTVIAVPVFVHKLGIANYGVFSILAVIGSIKTFSNLGLNMSLVKFLAEQGKCRESDYDIIVTLIITLLIIIPLSLLLIIFNKLLIINFFKIPINLYDNARSLFVLLIISNLLMLTSQVFIAIINANQRMYITYNLKFIYSIMYWGLLITILLLGYGLKQIGYGSLFASGFLFIITLYFAFKIWGRLYLRGLRANFKRIAVKQLSYSIKMYSSSLLAFFYEPLTKILISRFIGINEVGFYDIALKTKGYVISILSKPFEPLFPFLAQLKDKMKIRSFVHDLEYKSLLLILPIIIIFYFSSDFIVTNWLHNSNPHLLSGVKYISIFYLISLTTLPNYQFLIAKGHADKTILLHFTNVVVNILTILISFKIMGYYSIVLGNSLAMVLSTSLSLFYQYKYLNSLNFNSIKDLLSYLLCGLIIFGFCFLLSFFKPIYVSIILIFILIPFITFIIYRQFKFITKGDIIKYMGSKNKISIILQKAFYNKQRIE